jgi:hypothetical protein
VLVPRILLLVLVFTRLIFVIIGILFVDELSLRILVREQLPLGVANFFVL